MSKFLVTTKKYRDEIYSSNTLLLSALGTGTTVSGAANKFKLFLLLRISLRSCAFLAAALAMRSNAEINLVDETHESTVWNQEKNKLGML